MASGSETMFWLTDGPIIASANDGKGRSDYKRRSAEAVAGDDGQKYYVLMLNSEAIAAISEAESRKFLSIP
jgi:hypothetical protein